MVLKIAAIACLVGAGLLLVKSPHSLTRPLIDPVRDPAPGWGLAAAIGAAMVPVLFSFGGWQTTNFIAGEIREPKRNLGRALVIGVAGVIALYLLVNGGLHSRAGRLGAG